MYLLFDIGGTKTRLAITKNKKSFSKPMVFATPKTLKESAKLWQGKVAELTGNKKIIAAIGGLPGTMDRKKAVLLRSPNLAKWNGSNVKKVLENVVHAPVHLENDADLAGLGEAIFGAGQGYNIVAYLTISTGVGGGRIVNGKIDQNVLGFEPGHQIIRVDKKGKPESLEYLISGADLEERFGKKPENITNKKIWSEVEFNLALGLNNVMVHWSPDIIILGGSVMQASISVNRVEKHLKKLVKIYSTLPKVRPAKLKDSGGLWGALGYLQS